MWAEPAKWLKRDRHPTSISKGNYRVYTTQFDLLVDGDQLVRMLGPEAEAALKQPSSDLDLTLSRWRVVAEPAAIEAASAYKIKHSAQDTEDTVACLLLDHSGSLRGQRAMLAVVTAETIADYWDRIGIKYEILGFTTASWKGGRSREKWMKSGRPPNPGRLCDLLHIVHRSANDTYRGAPRSVRNLLSDKLLKENVDGEAVAWAVARLRDRREARKIMIVVSDGAPVDDSTLFDNDPAILSRHLKTVVASINDAQDIRMGAIGLEYDVSDYYAYHLSVACTDEPSANVVRFVAGITETSAAVPPPLPRPQRQPANPSTQWPVSRLFLGLIAIVLALAVVMAMLPAYARLEVFPFVLAGWLISLCLHEFGHAIAAYACGDLGVLNRGYLTLNPLCYTDLQFSIVWPLVFLAVGGIGLPGGAVYVNMWALRPVHRALVYAAGPLATLAVLIVLLAILHSWEMALTGMPGLHPALAFLALLQLTTLVLNLLPIPGLDGWGILAPALPEAWRDFGARNARISVALLVLSFLLVPAVSEFFWRLVFGLCRMTGLSAELAIEGLWLFQFWR
jgi:cobaltochelatase CobT